MSLVGKAQRVLLAEGILKIISSTPTTTSSLAQQLDVSMQNINWTRNKLYKAGVIEITSSGELVSYGHKDRTLIVNALGLISPNSKGQCSRCRDWLPKVMQLRENGDIYFVDDLGADWNNSICPDCKEETPQLTSRKCRDCNQFLPSSRYFKCTSCQPELPSITDDDVVYLGTLSDDEDEMVGFLDDSDLVLLKGDMDETD